MERHNFLQIFIQIAFRKLFLCSLHFLFFFISSVYFVRISYDTLNQEKKQEE